MTFWICTNLKLTKTMPQLDRVIVFTQIFWLFIIFSSSYIILTHFFLPLFLKSLKSRDLIIQANFLESKIIQEEFLRNQVSLNQVLSDGLVTVKYFYSKEFLLANLSNISVDTSSIDNNLVSVILNIMLYCDEKVLNSILLNSKVYSLSYNKH